MREQADDTLLRKWIWNGWESHRRTREICTDLGIPCFVETRELPRLLKYPYFMSRTLRLLARTRPDGLLVQSPSIVLALWAVVLKRVFRFALVIDAHNEGVRPYQKALRRWSALYRHMQRQADLTVVTNDRLGTVVVRNGGRPFVLPDRLPAVSEIRPAELRGRHRIVCISTFASDEPYEEVIEAGRLLGDDTYLYLTGNPGRLPASLRRRAAENVVFTGYLSDEDYWRTLKAATAVLDVTRLDDCLVCGGYEAVALEKPLIVTDTPVLRALFSKGTVYTRNSAEDISSAIATAIRDADRLTAEVKDLKHDLQALWAARRAALIRRLNELTARS